jgi:hypothetical protein
MKKLILLALVILTNISAASAFNINKGVLSNTPDVAFSGGSSMVRFTDGNFFRMTGYGDRVEMQSLSTMDWSFDIKVIYPSMMPLANLNFIQESDIKTIVASARHDNMTEYHIGVIKYLKNGKIRLRVVSAHIIPEPETFALLAGLLAFCFIALRRRGIAA